MNCPRCESSLSELDRDGITIDRCTGCRGVWLDRGELEKLLARSPARERDDQEERRRQHHDDDDDDHRDGRRGRRSWWEIFD